MRPMKAREEDARPVALALAGPTGVGKTAVSLPLAEALSAEIVGMDSMQLYRGMDIGTAKPTPQERRRVPHHMIDFLPVTAEYTVSDYKRDAEAAMDEITARGRLPLLVGGTGLYLWALRYDQSYGGVSSDPEFRRQMHALAEAPGGREALHERLRAADPAAAARLHANDVRRVIRALEVAKSGGPVREETRAPGRYRILTLGLTLPRETLYSRIDSRADGMLSAGLVGETEHLLRAHPADTWGSARQAIGYKEILSYLSGEIPMEEAVRLIKRNSRRYAKRQMTWFLRDPEIRWFTVSGYESVKQLTDALLCAIRTEFGREKGGLRLGTAETGDFGTGTGHRF